MRLSKPRLHYMDFLRAIAILYVLAIHHLDDYAGNFYHNNVDIVVIYSFLGLFIFISGYLLTLKSPIHNKSDLWGFIKQRFLRIWPLYVVAVILFTACSLMPAKDVLPHVFLLNVLLDNSAITLWFVSVLCVLYIFYPLIVYRYSFGRTLFIALWFHVIFGALREFVGIIDERIFLYFPLFLFGIICARHNLLERYFHNRTVIIVSVAVFACSVFLYFGLPPNRFFRQTFLIMIMISAIPLLVLLGKWFVSVVKRPFYAGLAYASFCMYLFHRVVFYGITNIYIPGDTTHILIYLTLLAIPIIYFSSFYIQKGYDRLRPVIFRN